LKKPEWGGSSAPFLPGQATARQKPTRNHWKKKESLEKNRCSGARPRLKQVWHKKKRGKRNEGKNHRGGRGPTEKQRPSSGTGVLKQTAVASKKKGGGQGLEEKGSNKERPRGQADDRGRTATQGLGPGKEERRPGASKKRLRKKNCWGYQH